MIFRALAAALVGGCVAAAAGAAEPGDVSFSGFGTLGGVVLDTSAAYFVPTVGLQKPGGGWVDLGPDSVIGVQMNADLGYRTDFTLQVRSSEDWKGHYDPQVGWAFLRHTWSPELSMRVGRLRVPFFMLSDSIQVNFAHPWVRLPSEVYGGNPFNDLDGADLRYRWNLGAAELELRPYFGSGRVEFVSGNGRLHGARGLNLALTVGEFSFHAGHGESRMEIRWDDPAFRQLRSALNLGGFSKVIKDLSGNDGYARFDSLGFQWDDGAWLVSGEAVRLRVDRYVNSTHAWFLSVARRVGDFTPYARVSRQVVDERPTEATLPQPALQQGLEAFLVSRTLAQHSQAFGVRWDMARNVAVKSEYARVTVDDHAWGSFFPRDVSDPFALGGKHMQVFSLSVDWVF